MFTGIATVAVLSWGSVVWFYWSVPVSDRSKARMDLDHSNTETVGLNPATGMDYVRLVSCFAVPCR